MRRTGGILLMGWFLFSVSCLYAADAPAPVGTKIAPFALTDTVSNSEWSLVERTRDAGGTVVVFLGTECPVSNSYVPKLNALAKKYADEGITFVAINSQLLDSAQAVKEHATQSGIEFPVLKDRGTEMADRFSVERVPTAYLLDATRTVRYKGRIDDQFSPGVQRAKGSARELSDALKSLVAGEEISVSHTAAAGCLLTRDTEKETSAAPRYTYAKDVAVIIQNRCQECHRPGEAGPFSLLTYEQARGWADMIREVVADGVMPPWHASAPHGHFRNDRRLTDTEKQTLLTWIDEGCPAGDLSQAPAPKAFVTGWRLGQEPDRIIKMSKPFTVPAVDLFGRGVAYQYVLGDSEFEEDVWVKGVEARPEFREAVHHILVYVLPPDEKVNLGLSQFARRMLATYVPGDQPLLFPPGYAKHIKKGSRLLFEMHYTPTGKSGSDQSMVGLVFTKEAPKHQVKSQAAINNKFQIPAGASRHEVTAAVTLEKPIVLTTLSPHMHLRGAAFRYELVEGDKRTRLLEVPRYNFNWQESYNLARPLPINAGARIECTAWFDNSAANPFNPNPESPVRWGEQTWEEMMIGFFAYYEAAGESP